MSGRDWMRERWFVIDVLRFSPAIGSACKVRIIISCRSMSPNWHNPTVSFWNCSLKKLLKQEPRPIQLLKKQSECMTGSLGTNRITMAITILDHRNCGRAPEWLHNENVHGYCVGTVISPS